MGVQQRLEGVLCQVFDCQGPPHPAPRLAQTQNRRARSADQPVAVQHQLLVTGEDEGQVGAGQGGLLQGAALNCRREGRGG